MSEENTYIKSVRSGRYGIFLPAVACASLAFAVYFPSLSNGFVTWDDDRYVSQNPRLGDPLLSLLRWSFFGVHEGNWHPLAWLSHAADYAIWGPDPFGHHLTSIILHGLNTFLSAVLAGLLYRSASADENEGQREMSATAVSMLTGILFGLHPLHVESVAWISERKDVLSAFFYLLALVVYVRQGGGKGSMTVLSLLFLMALMSKPMAVTLPLAMMIIDWYPLMRINDAAGLRRALSGKVLFFVIAVASAAVTFYAQSAGDAVVSVEAVPFFPRVLVAIRSSVMYLVKMVLPLDLIPLYPYPRSVSFLSVKYFVPLSAVLLTGIACSVAVKRTRLPAAALGFYAVSLLPVSGIVQVGSQEMADRYTYIPSLGPFLLAAACTVFFVRKMAVAHDIRSYLFVSSAFTMLLAVPLSYATIRQVGVWKNGITLWTREIEVEPQLAIAYNNRGISYFVEGRYEEARRDFDKGISLDTVRDGSIYRNRAKMHENLREYDKAADDYTKALFERRDSHQLYFERGIIHMKRLDYRSAESDFSSAIRLNPVADYSYYNNRAVSYSKLGLYEEAIRDYCMSIETRPGIADTYRNRGRAYLKLGRAAEAAKDFATADALSAQR